jgi:hypothetical protein
MDICTHLKYTLKLLICSWGKLLEALAFSSQDCILLYNGFYSFFFSSKTAFSSLVKFLVVLFNSLYLMLTGEGHAWRWTLDKASASWWKRCGFRVYLKNAIDLLVHASVFMCCLILLFSLLQFSDILLDCIKNTWMLWENHVIGFYIWEIIFGNF